MTPGSIVGRFAPAFATVALAALAACSGSDPGPCRHPGLTAGIPPEAASSDCVVELASGDARAAYAFPARGDAGETSCKTLAGPALSRCNRGLYPSGAAERADLALTTDEGNRLYAYLHLAPTYDPIERPVSSHYAPLEVKITCGGKTYGLTQPQYLCWDGSDTP